MESGKKRGRNSPDYDSKTVKSYRLLYYFGKTHDGTAFIIKSSIKHYEIDKHQRDFLQATSIMIETWNGCITISAVYSALNHVIKSEQ